MSEPFIDQGLLARLPEPLLAWFRLNARDLPWRHARDPYRIWISEIMLQQTRVAAVLGYYDRFLKAFPFELWILAVALAGLTCWWMANLLPIRGLSAILMLFPAELFPVIMLEDTQWRLALVVFAYACAIAGMFGMFYPWRIRQLLAWIAASPRRVRATAAAPLAIGALYLALGCAL